jgi:hypothetical protein
MRCWELGVVRKVLVNGEDGLLGVVMLTERYGKECGNAKDECSTSLVEPHVGWFSRYFLSRCLDKYEELGG